MQTIPDAIQRYFDQQQLKVFPRKLKNKLLILDFIIQSLEFNKIYSEFDINLMIQMYYQDYATLRRALIDYGYLDRDLAGQNYWRIK